MGGGSFHKYRFWLPMFLLEIALSYGFLNHHRLRGRASPVLRVTSHFNRKLQNLTPRISQTF